MGMGGGRGGVRGGILVPMPPGGGMPAAQQNQMMVQVRGRERGGGRECGEREYVWEIRERDQSEPLRTIGPC